MALAIGGLAHLWFLAAIALVLSLAAAIVGALVRGLDWKPELIVLVMLLMVLLLVTHRDRSQTKVENMELSSRTGRYPGLGADSHV